MKLNGVLIEDTYAEAFEGTYSRILVTAASRRWVETAARTAVGYGTSIIGCGAEAGIEVFLPPDKTPDKRPGAVLQFWTGKKKMVHELLGRIGQCILTAPTTAVFNWCRPDGEKLDIGFKMGFFGDGYQSERRVGGRDMTVIPVMIGEFLIEKDLGISKGVAGGNFLIMGADTASTLSAAEKASDVISDLEGVITSFPGGVCASGSKVGSNKYRFMTATTNEVFCPTLRNTATGSKVPKDVASVAEIVLNGVSETVVREGMKSGIEAASKVDGVKKISAANYGGGLGNVPIELHSLWGG